MKYENPKQIEGLINHLTYNSSEISDFNDPLSYIEGPTVTLNFIHRNKMTILFQNINYQNQLVNLSYILL